MISNTDNFAYRMRKTGYSYERIGRYIGCSESEAKVVIENIKRRIDEHINPKKSWTNGLPERAKNALLAEGFGCKEDLLNSCYIKDDKLCKLPNIGQKSRKIILEWLGINNPSSERKKHHKNQ